MLERDLQNAFPQFKRIWVQYANKGQYHLCITLFPVENYQYRMVFANSSSVNFETIRAIIQKDLDSR